MFKKPSKFSMAFLYGIFFLSFF